MEGKIAIIGGGIAGLYVAWRLRQHKRDCDVTVFEASDRLGGRIDTAKFGVFDKQNGQLTQLNAELGAMRFPREHRLLFELCEALGIKDVDKKAKPPAWRGPFQLQSLYHLRGMTLSDATFLSGEIPYRVRPAERSKTPADLLEYAIVRMLDRMIADDTQSGEGRRDSGKLEFLKTFRNRLQDHAILSPSEWVRFIRNDYEFAGIPLRNIGFWNVLKHFLSSEAVLLVHDGFGFLSVISNWNAPEAFKWLLTDFSPHQRFQTIPGGVCQIVEKLTKDLEERIIKERHELVAVHREGKRFRLRFQGKPIGDEVFDYLVLAMPPSALGGVRLFDGLENVDPEVERDWKKLIQCSRPHRLAKIVLAYDEPWWLHTRIPNAESGRLFTDLPMRQIHYLGPKWLLENGWSHKASGHSLVMVYNDSHYEAFWRAFHVHDKVYRSDELVASTLGRLPESIAEGADGFWGPRKMKAAAELPLALWGDPNRANLREALEKIDRRPGEATALVGDDKYEVRHRMEEKVRAQLSELHDFDVPMAIGGVYRDWSDEGGWHTWEPFVDVPRVKEIILQPFMERGKGFAVRPPVEEGERGSLLRLYVCGEAYSWEQGWVEGALMTAERVAAVIAGADGSCKVPEWFCRGDQARFDRYMYAELSVEKQRELDKEETASANA